MNEKIKWRGDIIAIQPRIRPGRSFDQRSHSYLGYSLCVDGFLEGESRTFSVGIGKALHQKFELQAGDAVEGVAQPVERAELESVEFYKVSSFKRLSQSNGDLPSSPPWLGVPPGLDVYRARGHRRLAVQTYDNACGRCVWGCRMAVEMIIDQWNPTQRKYRYETFCYGPKSCALYKAGPPRKVPGRKGMSWTEEDWVDEDATRHRGEDE